MGGGEYQLMDDKRKKWARDGGAGKKTAGEKQERPLKTANAKQVHNEERKVVKDAR